MSNAPTLSEEDSFSLQIHTERVRQIKLGYTPEHDRIGGIKHLVNLSIDYIYHNEKIKAAAVILAILELYRTLNERKWFLIGILVGSVSTAILIFVGWVILLEMTKAK